MGRRILPVLFSPQGARLLSSLPTFPSAAMQCQRWLQAQALAQNLTLPQSPGSGEKHEKHLAPSLVAAAVCLYAPGEKAELELQGRLRALLFHVSIVFLLGKVRKSKSQSSKS